MVKMKGLERAAACFFGWAVAALAFADTVRFEGQQVFVNELAVGQFRTGTAAQKAAALKSVVDRKSGKFTATASAGPGKSMVRVNGKVVLVIDEKEASAAASNSGDLAKAWASNLNRAFSLPAVQLSATDLKMGNGKDYSVQLVGKQAINALVASSDESVVKVTRAPGRLVLRGNLSGRAQISVSSAGQTQVLQVVVIPSAAQFPQTVSSTVSGAPTTSSTFRGAVEMAVWNQLKTLPGAELKFQVPDVSGLLLGQSKTVAVRVSASAPEAMSSEGIVYVTVRNQALVVEPESELWYDNVPESIEKMGQLFGGKINVKQPVRVLYHHDNDSPRGVLFHSQIVNPSDKPAHVLLIPGDSPIDLNPVTAGVNAANRFFRNWLTSSGEVVVIPPKGSLPVAMRRLAPKQTVSGLIYIALLDGGPDHVLMRSDAKLPFQASGKWASALATDFPWRIVGPQPIRNDDGVATFASEHVFPQPFRNLAVTYAVGGRHGFVRIGQEPIANATGERYLDGNFGVVYTIQAYVENPTSAAAEVEMVFEASAGYAGALFAVNGQVQNGPMLRPKGEARILKLRLEPGANRQFTVQTIPHSGGSYPATLALRAIEPATRQQSALKGR